MSNLKTTDDLWQELCDAAASPAAPVPPAPRVHPFAKLGEGPWRFEGVEHATGSRHCALCGKAIKNLYIVSGADRHPIALGSECILGLESNGFERHLVAAVKTRKREFDRQKRAAAKVRKAEREAVEFRTLYPKEVAWLEAYRGNFDFYLSLRSQFAAKGFLLENQVAALTRAVARDESRASAPKAARTFSLKAGETLIVSKFIAQTSGESFNLRRPHFAIEVVEVLGETEKAWKIRGKLAAKRTIHCACCGRQLDNAESRALGIGPICAEKWGVDSVEALGGLLKEKYDNFVCEFWVPKSQVKERT